MTPILRTRNHGDVALTILAAIGTYLIVCVMWLVVLVLKRSVGDYGLLETWIGPQYFADYSHGFVRRGLPGEVLGLVSDRGPRALLSAMWTLTFAALVGLILIVSRLIGRARGGGLKRIVLLLAVVVVSPISVSEIVLDPGRYDFVGIVAAAALVTIGLLGDPRTTLVLAAAVAVVAVASEELLLVFVAPFVLIAARRVAGLAAPHAQVARLSAFALAPALVVAGLSALTRPSASFVASMLARAGHPPTEVYDSATVLRLSFSDEVRLAYDWSHGVPNMLLSAGIWLAVYAAAVAAVAALMPRPPAHYWRSAGYFALIALGLGIVGVDDRRWWTLAFLAQLAFASTMAPSDRADPVVLWLRTRRVRAELLLPAAALGVALVTYNLPLTTIFVSDVRNLGYWQGLDHVWRAPLRWLLGAI
jgi:hypothetical protein